MSSPSRKPPPAIFCFWATNVRAMRHVDSQTRPEHRNAAEPRDHGALRRCLLLEIAPRRPGAERNAERNSPGIICSGAMLIQY